MIYKKLVLILLVLVVIGSGLFIWSKYKPSGLPVKILVNKNRGLNSDQQKIYTDKIKQAEKYLETIKPTASGANLEKANTYVFIGQQYFGLGQLEKSKKMYAQALSIDSKNEQALAGLGLTFLDAEDFVEAGKIYEQITEINPKNFNAWINLIQLRQKEGAGTGDIDYLYKNALEKTWNYIDIVTKYAQFQEQVGNIQSAIELWQQAETLNSSNAPVYQAEIIRLKALKK